MAEGEPEDVRLLASNLDADADLERVLIIEKSMSAAALVLKKENGAWWEIGSFVCCGPGSSSVDPFVELKQTVWYGTNDIVVRGIGGHGTGVGERRLMIYRVWRGRLYKVLDIVENAYNLVEAETSRLSYPETNSSSSQRVIAVHRVKSTINRQKATCIPYRWNADRFLFVQVAPTRSLCTPVE